MTHQGAAMDPLSVRSYDKTPTDECNNLCGPELTHEDAAMNPLSVRSHDKNYRINLLEPVSPNNCQHNSRKGQYNE